MDSSGDTVSELGVSIQDFSGTQPKIKAKRCNHKLKIYREFALATLSVLVESKTKWSHGDADKLSTLHVSALDALACSGIAGIQWKKHLSNRIHVTMADHDDTSKLKENTKGNAMSCSELKLDSVRVPGDPLTEQGESEIHICQAEAKTIMMMEAFNFIYVHPHKNCSSYFEPAFHSVSGGSGLVCFVITDVSMFARSPHVVKRYYTADVVKTEYLKEMAARIVIGSLTRAAAKYNKGISPQYVLSQEDCLLVCVKTSRGHAAADASQSEIERLLHCRFCEERTFLPAQLAPLEDPYSLLACTCKQNNPGKTAVVLGPMWKGPLSDPAFLSGLQEHGKQLGLSAKFFESVHLLQVESLCIKSDMALTLPHSLHCKHVTVRRNGQGNDVAENRPPLSDAGSACDVGNFENVPTSGGVGVDSNSDKPMKIESKAYAASETHEADNEVEDSSKNADKEGTHGDSTVSGTCTQGHKRKAEESRGDGAVSSEKRQRLQDEGALISVPFYYNVNKFRKTNIPKLDKLVTILHSAGHRASRTHFDPCAIRTSATVEEFLQVLG